MKKECKNKEGKKRNRKGKKGEKKKTKGGFFMKIAAFKNN